MVSAKLLPTLPITSQKTKIIGKTIYWKKIKIIKVEHVREKVDFRIFSGPFAFYDVDKFYNTKGNNTKKNK